jgi:hypothetical protein
LIKSIALTLAAGLTFGAAAGAQTTLDTLICQANFGPAEA